MDNIPQIKTMNGLVQDREALNNMLQDSKYNKQQLSTKDVNDTVNRYNLEHNNRFNNPAVYDTPITDATEQFVPAGRVFTTAKFASPIAKEATIIETGLDKVANHAATSSVVDDVQLYSGAKDNYGYLKSIRDKVQEKLNSNNSHSNGLNITGSYSGIRG